MSAAVAAAAAAAAAAMSSSNYTQRRQLQNQDHQVIHNHNQVIHNHSQVHVESRYESQKRRDWKTFGQYLRNHRPPLELSRCSGAHVVEFLRYLDQFGKTRVHSGECPFYGHPTPPSPCPCPLRQAWGSLDAIVGRLRAAFDEHAPAHSHPDANPFAARAVRLFLRDVRDSQAKARGIAYDKKKRKNNSNGSDDNKPSHGLLPLSYLN